MNDSRTREDMMNDSIVANIQEDITVGEKVELAIKNTYAVALYLEKECQGIIGTTTTKKRLYQVIVEASNLAEALGIVIQKETRPFYDFNIIFHVTTEIER